MQSKPNKNSKAIKNSKEAKVPKKRGRPFGSISNKTKKMLAEKQALKKVAHILGADQHILEMQVGSKRQRRMDSMLVKNAASLSQKSSSQSYNHLSQQLHVDQRQKSWSGQSQSNISRQINNNNGGDFVSINPYINSGNGNEKLSSLDGIILQDFGPDDRLEPAFFGA